MDRRHALIIYDRRNPTMRGGEGRSPVARSLCDLERTGRVATPFMARFHRQWPSCPQLVEGRTRREIRFVSIDRKEHIRLRTLRIQLSVFSARPHRPEIMFGVLIIVFCADYI